MRLRRRAATAGWLLLGGGLGLLGDDPGLTWMFYGLLAMGAILLLASFGSVGVRALRRPWRGFLNKNKMKVV